MRLTPVFGVIGFLLVAIGIAMLTALPFSYYHGGEDFTALLYSALITIAAGVGLMLFIKNVKGEDLHAREGFAIVTLGWVFASLFGSLPFMLSGAIPSFTDAFFETMSGFTTTGATILRDIEVVPNGLLYWRSMTHWIGGMGIILLSIAILPLLGVGGMQLFRAEATGVTKDKLRPRISETAQILWGVYALLTVVETALLWWGGMSFFDALTHSYSTVATGGFSTKNASIAYYQSPFIEYVVIVFMFLAGSSFALHFQFVREGLKNYFRNNEFIFYLLTIIAATALIVLFLPAETVEQIEGKIRVALFQVVSIMTTTGFITADYELWMPIAQLVLVLLMFNGGCAGSTAGGIKMVRILLLLKNSVVEIRRLVHPKAIMPIRFNGKSISPEIISSILAFFVLYITTFVTASLAMTALGLDLLSAAGSVAATLGNVGPGLGTVGAIDNYSHIPEAGKWVLSFCMLVGRLEIFTVFALFSSAFWKK